MKTEKLGTFLREVSNWNWEEFWRAERDPEYSSNEAIIFALVRAAAMERMDAIKLSLNRLDGKLKTPIRIEYPRIYFLFPNASLGAGEVLEQLPAGESEPEEVTTGEVLNVEQPEPEEGEEVDLKKMSLRQTVAKMSDYPRQLPQAVIDLAQRTEMWLRGQGEQPDEIPLVKSVVAAHLLAMAHQRDIGALTEVFDQLDGKLVETLQILGDDIFITNYSAVAPPEATPNKDGVLQMEAVQSSLAWASKLKRDE